jgi:hypothetical protein
VVVAEATLAAVELAVCPQLGMLEQDPLADLLAFVDGVAGVVAPPLAPLGGGQVVVPGDGGELDAVLGHQVVQVQGLAPVAGEPGRLVGDQQVQLAVADPLQHFQVFGAVLFARCRQVVIGEDSDDFGALGFGEFHTRRELALDPEPVVFVVAGDSPVNGSSQRGILWSDR